MKKISIFIIATWSAGLFGILEGVILNTSRAFPVLNAPYKTSMQVMWVAPLVDVVLFLGAGVFLLLFFRVTRQLLGQRQFLITCGFFIFIGFFAVLTAPKIIHPLSAAVLALGLSGLVARSIAKKEKSLLLFLHTRFAWLVIILLLLVLGISGIERFQEFLAFRKLPSINAKSPNVLIIVMDTVRYDRFANPREGSAQTPNLDRLAAQGARFDNAWTTASWSLPSQASILTGLYPIEHGADWPALKIKPGTPTLEHFFAQKGYITGAFSGNSSWITPEYLGHQFLRFQVYIFEDIVRRTSLGRIANRLVEFIGLHYSGRGKKAPQINDQFLSFLDDYPRRPFFAYLCYMDVNQASHHAQLNHPFWQPAPPVEDAVRAYDQSLQALDAQIGDLINELDRRGIYQDTLLVITSDHGESYGPSYLHDHEQKGHGTSLYPEQTRIPLFVIYPGKINPGQTVHRAVSLQAIPATITHLLDFKNSPFAGSPFMDAGGSGDKDEHSALLLTLNYDEQQLQSVVWDQWQYLKDLNLPQENEELYDIRIDPTAQYDLAPGNPKLPKFRLALDDLLNIGSRQSISLDINITPH